MNVFVLAANQFLDDLQKQALKAFTNLQKCIQRRIRPLLAPAILSQPATLLHSHSDSEVKLVTPPIGSIKSVRDIMICLDDFLEELEHHKIFEAVIRHFFVQAFYLIGAETFNQMTEDSRYCSYTNAFQIKFAVAQLLAWVSARSQALSPSRTRYLFFFSFFYYF